MCVCKQDSALNNQLRWIYRKTKPYIYIYIRMCVYVCVYMYMSLYVYIYIYMCVWVCVGVCKQDSALNNQLRSICRKTKTYIYIYIYVCVCMCVYMYMSVYVYIYIYICVCVCVYKQDSAWRCPWCNGYRRRKSRRVHFPPQATPINLWNNNKMKRDKYIDLARELKKLWNMKVTVIPIVIGALGTIPKGWVKGSRKL